MSAHQLDKMENQVDSWLTLAYLEQPWMYYWSGTERHCCIGAG